MIEPRLWAVLLLALLLGYLMGVRRAKQRETDPGLNSEPGHEMVMGLNYLINDQTDAAIETFIQALQSHTDTVEPSIALAKLYCRRGELDKAVLICQQQLARPSLSPEENAQVLQALGEAYLQSGLLDRAESLFLEVIESGGKKADAARFDLLRVYEKEGAWEKAVDIGNALLRRNPEVAKQLAHYYLALGEARFDVTEYRGARKFLTRARRCDGSSLRALLLQIQLDAVAGRFREMQIGAESLLARSDGPKLFASTLSEIIRSSFNRREDYDVWLETIFLRDPSGSLLRLIVSNKYDWGGPNSALTYIEQFIKSREGEGSADLKKVLSGLLFKYVLESSYSYGKPDWIQLEEDRLQNYFFCGRCGTREVYLKWQCAHCGAWK